MGWTTPGATCVWWSATNCVRWTLRAGASAARACTKSWRGFGVLEIKPLLKSDKANGTRMFTPTGLSATILVAAHAGDAGATGQLGTHSTRGRATAAGPHPFAASPLRHLMFAVRETAAADNSPEPGRQYLRDTFGQGYWGKRGGFVNLLEWLAALGNAEGMQEWAADSEAARMLAGRLRNDHA